MLELPAAMPVFFWRAALQDVYHRLTQLTKVQLSTYIKKEAFLATAIRNSREIELRRRLRRSWLLRVALRWRRWRRDEMVYPPHVLHVLLLKPLKARVAHPRRVRRARRANARCE